MSLKNPYVMENDRNNNFMQLSPEESYALAIDLTKAHYEKFEIIFGFADKRVKTIGVLSSVEANDKACLIRTYTGLKSEDIESYTNILLKSQYNKGICWFLFDCYIKWFSAIDSIRTDIYIVIGKVVYVSD